MASRAHPVVHLELLTSDPRRACDFYTELCGWRSREIQAASRSYQALDPGLGLTGGVVECAAARSLWLPYVGVTDIHDRTERARELGARVLVDASEGPAGWRSIVALPEGSELALWQAKR